jgi:hypothetical protein
VTDEMVWALREKVAKGMTVIECARTYGISQRIVAAVTGGTCYHYERYWPPEDLWRVRELLRECRDIDHVADAMGVARDALVQVVLKNADLYMPLDRRG